LIKISPQYSLFQTFCDIRTSGVLYFRYLEIKEYKVFFISAILILENSPCILKFRKMPRKEYYIFFNKTNLKIENTRPVL